MQRWQGPSSHPLPHGIGADAAQPSKASGTTELGIYGVYVGDGAGDVVCDTAAGHLMRTKPQDVKEAGVAAGNGYIDSPLLVD